MDALGYDAFTAELADLLEQGAAVTGQMLTEKHPLWRPRQGLGQCRLPFDERAAPATEAV